MVKEKILGLALLVALALPGCKKKEPMVTPPEPTPIVEKVKPAPTKTEIGNLWAKIYWDNQHKVYENGNLIYPGTVLDINGESYTIKKGDHLWSIAEDYSNR